jgi:DNA adenine methylase
MKRAADAFNDSDDEVDSNIGNETVCLPKKTATKAKLTQTAKPILKWVGGKTQILDSVLSLFPKEINNYYEPFVGGGSVLLGLLSCIKEGTVKLKGRIYASDLNENLIAVYKNVQEKPREIVKEVHKLVEQFSKCTNKEVNRKAATLQEALTSHESYYFWIRSQFNSLKGADKLTPTASAMFIFLNKTCFRGLYREGPNGFNVPYGNYKTPTIIEPMHIMEISKLISGVEFSVKTFSDALSSATHGDFVYMDPPYAPESETSFVGYTADGFGLDDHKTLFKLCDKLNNDGVKILMSNADVDLVKNAFSSAVYKTETISCRRAINSKKPDAKTLEVLISN